MKPRIADKLKEIDLDDILRKRPTPIITDRSEIVQQQGMDQGKVTYCQCDSFAKQPGLWPKCANCGHQRKMC